MLLAVIGRMCLSLIFILSGLQKLLDWQGTETYFVNSLLEVLNYTEGMPRVQEFIRYFTPYTSELLMAATAFELIGGFLLFLGLQVRFGAFLLALFLIPTTLVFHHFWFLMGPERDLQMIMFLKNLSIFGGLLYVLDMGKGVIKAKKEKARD
jgi:putative oxidoreductase